jgi:hypothetical protein
MKSMDEQKQIAKEVFDVLKEFMRDETLKIYNLDVESLKKDFDGDSEDFYESEDIYGLVESPFITVCGGAPRDWYFGNPANDIDMYIGVKHMTKWYDGFRSAESEADRITCLDYDFYGPLCHGWYGNSLYNDPKKDFKTVPERNFFSEECVNNAMKILGKFLIKRGITFTHLYDKSYRFYKQEYAISCMSLVFEMTYKGQVFDLIFIDLDKKTGLFDKDMNFTYLKFLDKEWDGTFGQYIYGTYDFDICRAEWNPQLDQITVSQSFIESLNSNKINLYSCIPVNCLRNAIFKHYPKLIAKFPNMKMEFIKKEPIKDE